MSKITCFVTQLVKYNGSVSLHFSCLTGNLFHRFAEVIFNISCYSTCMLTYMTCYFRWTKLHVGQQAMLFFNISCYSTCMLFLTCHAILRWINPIFVLRYGKCRTAVLPDLTNVEMVKWCLKWPLKIFLFKLKSPKKCLMKRIVLIW